MKSLHNYLKKEFTGSLITSAMFNAYLISTLKFQFEKNYKFNYITSAMFNAYKISTLNILINQKILKKNKKLKKKSVIIKYLKLKLQKMQRPPT